MFYREQQGKTNTEKWLYLLTAALAVTVLGPAKQQKQPQDVGTNIPSNKLSALSSTEDLGFSSETLNVSAKS